MELSKQREEECLNSLIEFNVKLRATKYTVLGFFLGVIVATVVSPFTAVLIDNWINR